MSGENTNNACAVCARQICNRCGRIVQNDAPRVGLSFTPDELVGLIMSTVSKTLQERMLCALGMLDQSAEQRTRMELASDEPACPSCPLLEQRLGIAEETIDELQGIVDDLENSAWDRSR